MTGRAATPPKMPAEVAAAFARFPAAVRARLEEVRALIYGLAADTGAGPLTETLKWGEPAYLTEASGSGSTIRLGRVRGEHGAAVLFNCQTTLVAGMRDQFAREFRFSGNRALLIDETQPLPEAALAICLSRALTYHRDKGKRA